MAITYGMSVKEFWEDNPDNFWAYRFSYYNKIKIEQEIFNNNAWLQGAYFYEAITVALNNVFSKQKQEYSKKAYILNNSERNNEDEITTKSNLLVAKIKERISQVQTIKGKENSSTTDIKKVVKENDGANTRIRS